MGLGLFLRTTTSHPEPLQAIERVLRSRFADVVEHIGGDAAALAVGLHPAAEDVEFVLQNATVTVSAKTSTAGPGYHAFVCELLECVGDDLGTKWAPAVDDEEGDETGYFASHDRAGLEAEMLGWLRGLCDVIAEQAADGVGNLSVNLPTDTHYEAEGLIITPMGPRDGAWLEATTKDPRRGIDLFPWWAHGLGAEHAFGRALARMWTEVRWRPPLDDSERALFERIDADLRRAHGLKPSLDLPWAEWAEITRWLERDDALAREVLERGRRLSPRIGYRRRPVRPALTGGWSIRVPGEMATELDEEGTWSAFMPGRTIWMSSFRFGDPESPTLSAEETLSDQAHEGEVFVVPGLPDGYAHRASKLTTDDGATQLTIELARPQRLAILTIVLDDDDDTDWAKGVAASMRNG